MDFAQRHPGAADVAVVGEVSGTTLDRDRGEKRALYARGIIPVYWIINLIDNQIEVYTDPSPAYGYQTRVIYRPGEQLSIVVNAQARGMISVPDLLLGGDEETDEVKKG